MTPRQQFICTLVVGAVVPLVIAFLTFLQGQNNKATALRNHEEVRRWHRFSTHAPAPEPERPARAYSSRTNIEALAESVRVTADNAADDTVRVLVQPTTVARFFGAKSRLMTVRALRSAK